MEKGRKDEESLQKALNVRAVERGEVGTQSCRKERKRDKGKEVQAARVKNFTIDFGDKGGK